jgi:hypothetical protein
MSGDRAAGNAAGRKYDQIKGGEGAAAIDIITSFGRGQMP